MLAPRIAPQPAPMLGFAFQHYAQNSHFQHRMADFYTPFFGIIPIGYTEITRVIPIG